MESKLCINRAIQDASRQRLVWNKPPLSVLVIKKVRDTSVIPPFLDLIRWLIWVSVYFVSFICIIDDNLLHHLFIITLSFHNLHQEKRMVVFVEPAVLDDLNLRSDQAFSSIIEKLCTFKENSANSVDLIICLGGDGTLLYASSLFQVSVI